MPESGIRNVTIERDDQTGQVSRIRFEFGAGYRVEARYDGRGTTLRLHRGDLTIDLDDRSPARHYERALNLLHLHLR
jgi:hypothetical protein